MVGIHVIKIFFCYAHEDEVLLNKLKTHLRPLQRQGLIDFWHDCNISAGAEWKREIDKHLNTAQIILLLVSPDFMDSDYCYSIEMKRALQRHKQGEASVIPIILRWVRWQETPLGELQTLPKDAKPVKSWLDLDEAFYYVVEGIRKVIAEEYENRIQAAISARDFHFELEYTIDGSIDINPEIISRGKRLILSYHIHSTLPFEFSVWLGANLRVDEQYFYNAEEDTEVLLRLGNLTYTRFLTIRESWLATNYYLEAAVHYGIRSNPRNSILVAQVWIHPTLLKIT